MPTRRAVLALALAGLSRTAYAASGGPKEITQPGSLLVEWWDRDGLFHLVNADLLFVLAKEGIKISKTAIAKIPKTLSSMPWEEFNHGNPAVTIKSIALECARADPLAGPFVTDVLIAKLLIR